MAYSISHAIRTVLPNPELKSPVAGIDISLWEPDEVISWGLMDERVKFVIAKATELDWVDPQVHIHCQRISKLNYTRGIYHFLHENDIDKQAKKFLQVAREVGALSGSKWMFEIPPVLDVEVKAVSRGTKFAGQIKTWLNLVEDACGIKPVIYTSQNFWNVYVCWLVANQLTAPNWTDDYPLWVAQYPGLAWVNAATGPGKLPAGWSDYIGWQYYDAYRFEAIRYNGCDVNLMKPEYFDSLSHKPTQAAGFAQVVNFSDQTFQNLN